MGVLPNTRPELIQFFTQRLADWQANPEQIGLSAAQVTELSGLTASASTDYQDALDSRQESKDRTFEFHQSADALRTLGSALVATIKAYAETTSNPGVYALASIPEPAPPTPSADPVTPTDITLGLRPSGFVSLEWSGSLAGGTFYEVQRSLNDGQAWATIASVPARAALDEGVPPGSARSMYRIRAVKPPAGAGNTERATRYSPWSAPQFVFLGNPSNQLDTPVAGSIAPATGPSQQAG